MSLRRIKAFERSDLVVGRGGFLPRDLEAIARFEDSARMGAFRVGWNKVTIVGHVGVFAAGDLVLDILPKAESDRVSETEGLKAKWFSALIRMLRVAYGIDLEEAGRTPRETVRESLLDIYAKHFLDLVEGLLRGGLVKGYRRVRERVPGLKGKAIPEFGGPMAVTHPESLLCEFDSYDIDTPHNILLGMALRALRRAPLSPDIADRSGRLSEAFPESVRRTVKDAEFASLAWNRRTTAYRPAMDMARLILLGLAPAQSGAGDDSLALLLPMDELFEAYIGALMARSARKQGASVSLQSSCLFWGKRRIRPDIIVARDAGKTVIDTKWKILRQANPSIEDLRQMYVYNRYVGSNDAWLLYPRVGEIENREAAFRNPDGNLKCGLLFMDLFKGDELDLSIGDSIFDEIGVSVH